MSKIETLYGIEVIVHFPAPTEKKVNGLIQAAKLEEWVEGVVIRTGIDCKKDLKMGDIVIVSKELYLQSPVVPKSQFDLPVMELGDFRIMTEHCIAMKLEGTHIFDADFEEPTQEDMLKEPVKFDNNRLPNVPTASLAVLGDKLEFGNKESIAEQANDEDTFQNE